MWACVPHLYPWNAFTSRSRVCLHVQIVTRTAVRGCYHICTRWTKGAWVSLFLNLDQTNSVEDYQQSAFGVNFKSASSIGIYIYIYIYMCSYTVFKEPFLLQWQLQYDNKNRLSLPEDLKCLVWVLQLIREPSPPQQSLQVRLFCCLLWGELSGEIWNI